MDSDPRVQHEEVLRRAVLAGDEKAWQTWYQQSFDALKGYVSWRCGGRGEWIEEIVQDTWLTAVRRVRQFDPHQGSFMAWLRGIAANVLRNHLRRQRALPQQHAKPTEFSIADGSTEIAENRERAERIAAALDALPERQEAVLRAKYLEGFSVADISAAWGDSPKAVESLLSRARHSFRALYEKNGNPQEMKHSNVEGDNCHDKT
jgi:RNA polymerase sigma-70 factor, ECF subfamily